MLEHEEACGVGVGVLKDFDDFAFELCVRVHVCVCVCVSNDDVMCFSCCFAVAMHTHLQRCVQAFVYKAVWLWIVVTHACVSLILAATTALSAAA